MFDYETLGEFYLGREFDMQSRRATDQFVMYDARNLTTHAVIVGMTGSGKTGLGITLLEEAAIDGIPAIIIDPKGDMGNLALTFPRLSVEEFRPWLDPEEAARSGQTLDEFARDRAELWRRGLQDWDQPIDRVTRLREAAEVSIYTPGSEAGIPLTALKSLDAPPPEIRQDGDALRERVAITISGLLTLLGINADPLRSREHILLSTILERAWQDDRDLDLLQLIREIQNPPFSRIGVMDLEAIFPAADRMQLAMTINNVLASPSFSSWTQGEPLDVPRLLYADDGRPRLSVVSIAHLGERERMFFVTILLNEIISWMRTQPGTSSLRAIIYMDEVFGYLPPTANPPSKIPLLTLLKQARAYGVGLVLATQNPVDLDYKALSNAGSWFLGRLQTERDKLRLLDGLEGAAASSSESFDRRQTEQLISSLTNRVFLMNNAHESAPVVFQTRWALSYLRGPMTRAQLQSLKSVDSAPTLAGRNGLAASIPAPRSAAVVAASASASPGHAEPPILPPDIRTRQLPVSPRWASETIVYRPGLLGIGRLHYVDAKSLLDFWEKRRAVVTDLVDAERDPWAKAQLLESRGLSADGPVSGARFADLPVALQRSASYKSWTTSFKNCSTASIRWC